MTLNAVSVTARYNRPNTEVSNFTFTLSKAILSVNVKAITVEIG